MSKQLRGLGVGWRPEIAYHIHCRPDISFIELVAENHFDTDELPLPVRQLQSKGVQVVIHGIGLSLAGASFPDKSRLLKLAKLARKTDAAVISEHISFVRSGELESGHLLPTLRTKESVAVIVENIRYAQDFLPVPLVLENIASAFEWPDNEMTEADFLSEILEKSNAQLLLDVSNLYANASNEKWDVSSFLDNVPLNRISYMHIAGGLKHGGKYHDTHAHALNEEVLAILKHVSQRIDNAAVLLERDDNFTNRAEFNDELNKIKIAAGLSTTMLVETAR